MPSQSNIFPESWTFRLIQNQTPLPHSLHLHGHDAHILSRRQGLAAETELNSTTPQRRNTLTFDAGGYITIAIENANPGAWLLDCQQAFQASNGLGVRFLVLPTEIPDVLGDLKGFEDGCVLWQDYQAKGGGNQNRLWIMRV